MSDYKSPRSFVCETNIEVAKHDKGKRVLAQCAVYCTRQTASSSINHSKLLQYEGGVLSVVNEFVFETRLSSSTPSTVLLSFVCETHIERAVAWRGHGKCTGAVCCNIYCICQRASSAIYSKLLWYQEVRSPL